MSRAIVFISYHPEDERDKTELVTHLGALRQQIEIWTDDRILPGSDRDAEIQAAISRASVAILLVTSNFLNSELLLQSQVEPLLERRKRNEVIFFPIIARSCAWQKTPWLAGMGVKPQYGKPVWREGGRYVDEELTTITTEIAEEIRQTASKLTPPVSPIEQARSEPERVVSPLPQQPLEPAHKIWKDMNIMNPDIFIEQDDVNGLISALIKFASRFTIAGERQDILSSAGVEADFMASLNFNATPVVFANSLLARFREYRASEQRLNYHPMVAFLAFLLDTGASHYGLEDQQVTVCARLVERGKENFKALVARSAVGRIESPQGTGVGSGVLVGPDLLLTCRHVFSQIQQAWVRFGYKAGSYGLEDLYELDLNFVSSHSQNQLDYALVRIKGQTKPRPIRPANKPLSSGPEARVRIIHHPQGQPLVVSGPGQIVQVGEDYIDHTLSTDKGSSGAPIFDQGWELVAIHRGDTRMGRQAPPDTTEGLPIYAIWDRLSPHLM